MKRPIDEIHEAAGRLHATAWHGRTIAPPPVRARFSIPRHATDDDEIVYAAIEELKQLREVVASLTTSNDGEKT